MTVMPANVQLVPLKCVTILNIFSNRAKEIPKCAEEKKIFPTRWVFAVQQKKFI